MRRSISAILTLAAFVSIAANPAVAGEVWLTMDYVKPFKIDRAAGQIIVGNPGIADVQVQDANSLLLYGKSPGATNMYIFDEDGEAIDNLIVRVRALGDNMVTFQHGGERTTFNCMTVCEPTVTIGDGESFGNVAGQITQKFQQASTGAN